MEKVCSKCKIPQPLENFTNDKYKGDGKKSQCKSCVKQYRDNNREHLSIKSKLNYIKNKEKISENGKQRREENKEKIRLYQKRWYENNKDKRKQYVENNKDKISITKKQWENKHKSVICLRRQQYRSENKEWINLRNKLWRGKNRDYLLLSQKLWRGKNRDTLKVKRQEYSKTDIGKAVARNAFHKRRNITKQGDVTTIQLKELVENNKSCFYCNTPLLLNETHIDHYIPLSKGGLHTISNLRMACKTCNLRKSNKLPEEFFALTLLK